MNSPSASSATLSHESIDEEIRLDIDVASPTDPLIGEDDAELAQEIAECLRYSTESEPSPSMRAAEYTDGMILRSVLQLGIGGFQSEVDVDRQNEVLGRREHHHSRWDDLGPNAWRAYRHASIGISSPMLAAIRAGLHGNVRILLDAGADPNGLPLHLMEEYAALFLRFRPPNSYGSGYLGCNSPTRDELLDRMRLPQMSSITTQEIEDRFWDGMAPFWCEEGFTPAKLFPHGEAIPSLVEAARCGQLGIFEHLLEAGADASFWRSPQSFVPSPATPSSLSISSPIHAALQARNIGMLRYLLEFGFDPNTMPLSNPTRCITPLMATIVYNNQFDSESFFWLSRCPNINFELRTPVYRVHLLHFAVASLDMGVIHQVVTETPLKNAGATALGHTLLHVACMPAKSTDVQRQSAVIFESIHETRNLHSRNDRPRQEVYEGRSPNPPKSRDASTDEDRAQQLEVVVYLWENSITDIEKKDLHDNTALHYLAGCKIVNMDLVNWLREKAGVEKIWQSAQNRYGSTPQDLYHSAKNLVLDPRIPEWITVRRRSSFGKRREQRRKDQDLIWGGLLNGELGEGTHSAV